LGKPISIVRKTGGLILILSLSIAKTYLSLAKVGAVLDAGRAESPATSRVFTASVGRNDTVAGRGERRSVARATKRPEQALVVARVGEGVVELGLWLGHVGASPDLQCDTGGVGNSLAVLTARGDWCWVSEDAVLDGRQWWLELTLHETGLALLVDVLDEDGVFAVVCDIGIAGGESGRGEDGSSADDGGDFGEHGQDSWKCDDIGVWGRFVL